MNLVTQYPWLVISAAFVVGFVLAIIIVFALSSNSAIKASKEAHRKSVSDEIQHLKRQNRGHSHSGHIIVREAKTGRYSLEEFGTTEKELLELSEKLEAKEKIESILDSLEAKDTEYLREVESLPSLLVQAGISLEQMGSSEEQVKSRVRDIVINQGKLALKLCINDLNKTKRELGLLEEMMEEWKLTPEDIGITQADLDALNGVRHQFGSTTAEVS